MTQTDYTDRRVHARDTHGLEVVRYDRAGKWCFEKKGHRAASVSFAQAVAVARDIHRKGGEVFLGLPGGKRFDARVRQHD